MRYVSQEIFWGLKIFTFQKVCLEPAKILEAQTIFFLIMMHKEKHKEEVGEYDEVYLDQQSNS